MMNSRLGIYLHIPFCLKKCSYCNFVSFSRTDKIEEYIESLLQEIEFSKHKGKSIATIYIGGGTPSIIPLNYITKIIGKLKEEFDLSQLEELTIEVNPGTVDLNKLKTYYQLGINRVSVGVQSFDHKILKGLGRIHTEKEVYNTIFMLREIGFKNISIDLMYGLPFDTVNRIESDLEKALRLNPEHISVYGLIVEEKTLFHKEYLRGNLILPEEEELLSFRKKIDQILNEAGYSRYEISNYSKEAYESKHNLIYWHNEDYLGFGLNSTSKMDNNRYRNSDDLEEYLETANNLAKYDLVEIDEDISVEDGIMLGLRLIEGIDIESFNARYKIDIEKKYKEVILELEKLQLMKTEDGFLKFTKRGLELSNYCILRFLS